MVEANALTDDIRDLALATRADTESRGVTSLEILARRVSNQGK